MRYEEYHYLWPPRPDHAVSPELLSVVEKEGGYIAQIKKNGTNTVLFVRPSTGELVTKTRHKDDHKIWKPDRDKLQAFLTLPGDGWYVFVAELLHSKVPGIRDVLYVHDILVLNGDHLIGKTEEERHQALLELFHVAGKPSTYSHWEVNQYLWVAKQYGANFRELFDSLDKPEDEGIVLKLKDQELKLALTQSSNNAGMLKARKQHKNFSF